MEDTNDTQYTKRKELIEVGVFLLLIVPSMVLSFFAIRQGNMDFTLVALSSIFRDLGLVSLVAYFLWSNRQQLGAIGWKSGIIWQEILLGIALPIPIFLLSGLLEQLLRSIGLSPSQDATSPLMPPQTAGGTALAVVLVIVVAFSEETLFRGYLMRRFGHLTSSPAAAVILSSLVFALGHGYQGATGLITVGVIGVVLALVYEWRDSLVAPMIIHFLQNLMALVIAPLLQSG